MNLLGFNFDKISVEKLSDKAKEIKINTNVEIKEVFEVKADLLKSEDSVIALKFEYLINYAPDFAKIDFKGNIVVSMSSDEAKDILNNWKNKKLSDSAKLGIFNVILTKCNIKAFQLEEDLNLPLHLPLFKIKKSDSD
jgi:hypothetical protein